MHTEPINIIVNGRPKHITETRISFDQVVVLAFGALKPDTAYTVTYKRGPKENKEGIMSSGDSVDVKSGMEFNVTETSKS